MKEQINEPIQLGLKLEDADKISIDILPRSNFHRWLQQIRILPRQKHFIIPPLPIGRVSKISTIMLEIKLPVSGIDISTFDMVLETVRKHSEKIAEIIAIAVTMSTNQKPKRTIKFISTNCKPEEMISLLALVMKHMGLPEFMACMQMIKGLDILNPRDNPDTDK